MFAIILAGGFGKRLGKITSKTPKPLLKIGKKQFILYLLDNLQKYGFKTAIICIHYLGKKFKDLFFEKYKNINIIFSEEKKPLGTGGAIKKALKIVNTNESILVLNGDSFTNLNYFNVAESHKKSKKNLTIVLKKIQSCERYGQVIFDENLKIKEFIYPGKKQSGFINIGVYMISKKIFDDDILSESFSFENDFLVPRLNKINPNIFFTEDYFIDIGVPKDLIKASIDLEKIIKY